MKNFDELLNQEGFHQDKKIEEEVNESLPSESPNVALQVTSEKSKEKKTRTQKKPLIVDEKQTEIEDNQGKSEKILHVEQKNLTPTEQPQAVTLQQDPVEETLAKKDETPSSHVSPENNFEKKHEQRPRFDRHGKKMHHQRSSSVVREKKPVSEMNLQELVYHARRNGILGAGFMTKAELLEKITYVEANPDIEIDVEGILEKLPDGFGFLRSAQYDYTSSPDDVYVSPSQIRRFGIRNGDTVRGVIRKLREEERYFALLKVTQINYEDPLVLADRPHFDSLIPVYPHQKFALEFEPTSIATRIMDLFTPIGKGQRGLIVAPPKVGKTMLLKELARAIITNHPDTFLMVLHIDERPEEVADMRRMVKGKRAEVISSTFDETAERHVQVAELALEKAKRLVECGYDVVILLDSITRLARAFNTIAPASGKVLTGGIDANALQRPKRFFGAARCAEKTGSSLTIIASALIETGSRMDEVIFEEFKGTGNMEINMTRKLSNRRVFPAFDLLVSGTRRDDLLLSEEILNKVWVLQKFLGTMNTVEGMEFLIEKIKKTKTNDEFLEGMVKQSRSMNGSSTTS